MTAVANMLVQLRELPASRSIELSNDFVGNAIAEMPTRAILERPAGDPDAGSAQVRVQLHGDEDGNVYARGTLNGWFALGCSRCVEPVKVAFSESLDATFRPTGTIPGDNGAADELSDSDDLGLELSDEDLDLYSYEGEAIDLELLLREQLVLAVPFAPLCSEDCQGLCPQCGADKNREPCACEPPIDPRLAALQNIKL